MKEESVFKKYKENIGETRPWDLLNPSMYLQDSNVSNLRLQVCRSCPEFIKLTSQCKKCGCFMTAKTKLKEAACPLGKW